MSLISKSARVLANHRVDAGGQSGVPLSIDCCQQPDKGPSSVPVATPISDRNYGGNKSMHATFGIKEAFGAERNAPCTSCYLTT
jgi:hypothetical protein